MTGSDKAVSNDVSAETGSRLDEFAGRMRPPRVRDPGETDADFRKRIGVERPSPERSPAGKEGGADSPGVTAVEEITRLAEDGEL